MTITLRIHSVRTSADRNVYSLESSPHKAEAWVDLFAGSALSRAWGTVRLAPPLNGKRSRSAVFDQRQSVACSHLQQHLRPQCSVESSTAIAHAARLVYPAWPTTYCAAEPLAREGYMTRTRWRLAENERIFTLLGCSCTDALSNDTYLGTALQLPRIALLLMRVQCFPMFSDLTSMSCFDL
jgi:hypothetical protein